MQKYISKFCVLLCGFVLFGYMIFISANEGNFLMYFSVPLNTFYSFQNELYVPVSLDENQKIDTEIPYYYGKLSDDVSEIVYENKNLGEYRGEYLGYAEGDFIYGSAPNIYEALLPDGQTVAEDLLIVETKYGYSFVAKLTEPYSEKMRNVSQWREYAKEFALEYDLECRRERQLYDHTSTNLM